LYFERGDERIACTMMFFLSVNTFSGGRIALIFAYDASKDRFSALDGTLFDTFFKFLIVLESNDPKTKITKYSTVPGTI